MSRPRRYTEENSDAALEIVIPFCAQDQTALSKIAATDDFFLALELQ